MTKQKNLRKNNHKNAHRGERPKAQKKTIIIDKTIKKLETDRALQPHNKEIVMVASISKRKVSHEQMITIIIAILTLISAILQVLIALSPVFKSLLHMH